MKRILSTISEKWPEYLLEILVLIIGIYGAFALDSWNEDRANKKLVEDYYCRFLADISQDEKQINLLLDASHDRLVNSNRLIAALIEGNTNKKEIMAFLLKSVSKITYQFHPISAGYDDLKSSGNLNTFTDQIVVDQIGNYLQEARGFAANISLNGTMALNELFGVENLFEIGFVDPSFFTGIDTTILKPSLLNHDPLTISQQRELKNVAAAMNAANDRNIAHYMSIKNQLHNVKQLIETKCQNGQ